MMREFVCSPEQRKGLLVAVISGGFGREQLEARKTAALLHELEAFGCDVVWSVVDRDAERYERDQHEMAVYPMDWAVDYAEKREWHLLQLEAARTKVAARVERG